ncbi:hypothetical protein GCM10011572_49840 [Pseudoduganella buxea]|nr:hypothetical protein GCM10011572_49840 [Pseudoduganella buxea]
MLETLAIDGFLTSKELAEQKSRAKRTVRRTATLARIVKAELQNKAKELDEAADSRAKGVSGLGAPPQPSNYDNNAKKISSADATITGDRTDTVRTTEEPHFVGSAQYPSINQALPSPDGEHTATLELCAATVGLQTASKMEPRADYPVKPSSASAIGSPLDKHSGRDTQHSDNEAFSTDPGTARTDA